MTPEEFVRNVKLAVFDPAVEGTLRNLRQPPGRQPADALVKASRWFNALPARDQQYVRWTLRVAAYSAVFGLLSALDGARTIDNAHGEICLTYIGPDGLTVRLNQPEVEELHALWTNEVFPYFEALAE